MFQSIVILNIDCWLQIKQEHFFKCLKICQVDTFQLNINFNVTSYPKK